MNDALLLSDPVLAACRALELARKIRAWTEADPHASDVQARVSRLVATFDAPGLFSEAFVDEVRTLIAWCDARAKLGIATDYEAHDAWDERGRETTGFHPVTVATSEARQLCALRDNLTLMAGMVERTLNLVAAGAIVTRLRRSPEGKATTGAASA